MITFKLYPKFQFFFRDLVTLIAKLLIFIYNYIGDCMLSITDKMFIEKSFPVWDKLNEDEKKLFLNNTRVVSYKKGDIIFKNDSECLGLIIIKSGKLRTFMMSEEGREITLYRLETDDICVLSASCVIYQITFDSFIEAEKNSEIFILNVNTFSKLFEQNIYFSNFVLSNATERFSDVMWTMQQILFMNIDKRLAIFLIDESNKSDSLKLNITHEQIAKYIGSSREVISRMLNYFQKQKYIKLFRGGLLITDKDKLKELIKN